MNKNTQEQGQSAAADKTCKVVTDGRTLRAMAKADKITWPVPIHGERSNGKPFRYVDEEKRSRSFTFKNAQYRIDYVDGCFFPFVFKV